MFNMKLVSDYSLSVEGKEHKAQLYYVSEIKLYVLRVMRKNYFCTWVGRNFQEKNPPTEIPTSENKIFSKGWTVFKSEALNKKTHYGILMFDGGQRVKKED